MRAKVEKASVRSLMMSAATLVAVLLAAGARWKWC